MISPGEFHQQFKAAVKESKLSNTDISGILKISQTTFDRWLSGKSSPYITGRLPAIEAIKGNDHD